TVGAIFINYALNTGGTKKVLSLFQNSADSHNWDDPLATIKYILGIEKNQINSFIKKQIE
ncbi:MAG: hypothetical protein ACM3N1_00165, partial [Accumulibacter sp.]